MIWVLLILTLLWMNPKGVKVKETSEALVEPVTKFVKNLFWSFVFGAIIVLVLVGMGLMQ